jgi:hypothetical protein
MVMGAFVFGTSGQYPSSTTSTSGVMMGLGGTMTVTPNSSGRIKVTLVGWGLNSGTRAQSYCGVQPYYGTGTAPSHGATITGTACCDANACGSTAAGYTPVTFVFVIEGLTLNTAYWIDLGVWTGNASDPAEIGIISWIIEEF